MSHPLSLQPNTDCRVSKTNQCLQPGRTNIRDFPLVVIKHAMSFLPFGDVAVCKRVFKKLDLDYVKWTKLAASADAAMIARYLTIQNGFSSPATFALEMRKMGQLRTLNLGGVQNLFVRALFCARSEDEIPFFPHLKKLVVPHAANWDEQIIQGIAFHAPGFTHLEASFSASLLELCKLCVHLEKLSLTSIADDHRTLLTLKTSCPRLKELSITSLEGEQLKVAAKIAELRSIELAGVTDEGLKELAAHPQLQEVTICDFGNVTSAGIRSLSQVVHLCSLALLGDFAVSDLTPLADAKALKKLTLRCFRPLKSLYIQLAEVIVTLQNAKNIQELDISGSRIRRNVFESLGKCAHLRSITLFMWSMDEEITDETLGHLLGCQELRVLKIGFDHYSESNRNSIQFTVQGLVALVKRLPHLRILDLHRCIPTINADQVEEALAVTHPKLFVQKK